MKQPSRIKLPFKPTDTIFRWGPIPGKFLYTSTFVDVNFKHFRKRWGENWSESLFLFKNNRMLWINEQNALHAAGKRVFLKYLLPQCTRTTIYTEWKEHVAQITKIEKYIDKLVLAHASNKDILHIWNDLHSIYIKFWITGTIPELANYGSDVYLGNKLRAFITRQTEIATAMEILTAPVRVSFYQEEEIALALAKNITAHQKKYSWLKNSYAETQIAPVEFFAQRKKELDTHIEKNILKKLQETQKKKNEIQKRYALPAKIMNAAKAVSDGIAWQDERKKYIFITLHYQDILLKEISKCFDYTFDELHNLSYSEIPLLLRGKNMHTKLAQRAKGFGMLFSHSCTEQLSNEEIEYMWKLFEYEKTTHETRILKGIIASKGTDEKITGKVKILLNPAEVESFKKGEILVAPMTSPEYIFAMRKAAAIITDAGGLTSHAAIVSRELRIPCLLGTKRATQLLKDGDRVEIDTAAGTAKKL